MSETHEAIGPEGHTHHAGESRYSRNKGAVPWRLVYVISLVAVAASLFVFVPDGRSLALLILLAGLMVLHHLPGGHGHGRRATAAVGVQGDAQRSPERADRAEVEK